MRITEILRRIWLFSANKIKSSESFSKHSTQLIVELNSSLRHIIVTIHLNIRFQLTGCRNSLDICWEIEAKDIMNNDIG